MKRSIDFKGMKKLETDAVLFFVDFLIVEHLYFSNSFTTALPIEPVPPVINIFLFFNVLFIIIYII
jgi:hypothetical protein